MSTVTLNNNLSPGSLYRSVANWGWGITILGILAGLFSAQPALTATAWLVVPVLVRLLWRPSEPPVLLFAALMLWLMSSIQVFYYAGYLGQPLSEVYGGLELERAIWLSLAGVLVVALGMRTGLGGLCEPSHEEAVEELSLFSIHRLFAAYLASLALVYATGASVILGFPRIAQLLFAVLGIRWALFFLLAYVVLARRQGYRLLMASVLLEVGLGFTGFFSGFKDFFYVFVVAAITARPKIDSRQLAVLAVLSTAILTLGLFWTTIKPEYRAFLNRGTGEQSIRVSMGARMDKLTDLALQTSGSELAEGVEPLVQRLGYVDYFAHTIRYVPENIRYEGGRLWLAGLEHILKPRIFFPDKPSIDDSEITRRYTGLQVAGAAQGTSINLGYFAESYVDFGPYGMYVPIFLVGLMFGLMYRYFVVRSRLLSIGFALACALLVFGASDWPSIPKLLGGNFVNFVVMVLLLRYVAPSFVRWVRKAG